MQIQINSLEEITAAAKTFIAANHLTSLTGKPGGGSASRQPLPSLTGSEGINGLTECQAVLSDRSRPPLLRTDKVGGGASLIAFYASMGAGKTTFIRALCHELGVQEPVTSPTFAIVNEYEVNHNDELRMMNDEYDEQSSINNQQSSIINHQSSIKKIYHFDFYRIRRIEEVYDMGFEDYLCSGQLCLIEWPELIEDLLPENTIRVTITAAEDGARCLQW